LNSSSAHPPQGDVDPEVVATPLQGEPQRVRAASTSPRARARSLLRSRAPSRARQPGDGRARRSPGPSRFRRNPPRCFPAGAGRLYPAAAALFSPDRSVIALPSSTRLNTRRFSITETEVRRRRKSESVGDLSRKKRCRPNREKQVLQLSTLTRRRADWGSGIESGQEAPTLGQLLLPGKRLGFPEKAELDIARPPRAR